MATTKRQIAFYADDVVADWYASLATGEGTRRINAYLHDAIKNERTVDERFSLVEKELVALARYDGNAIRFLLEEQQKLIILVQTAYQALAGGKVANRDKIDKSFNALYREVEDVTTQYRKDERGG